MTGLLRSGIGAGRISSGAWTPDYPIPSEARLATEFGLSVGTVRKGVDGLVQEGLLERRQGSGTYVRAPSFNATLFRFFQLREADANSARRLLLNEGDPLAIISRTAFDIEDKPVEWPIARGSAAKFKYRSEFS